VQEAPSFDIYTLQLHTVSVEKFMLKGQGFRIVTRLLKLHLRKQTGSSWLPILC